MACATLVESAQSHNNKYMPLDPRHLNAFISVSEQGSIGRAAAELSLTQPALSRIIKRLESQLGVPLFELLPTGMVLTLYGRSLLPYAKLLKTESAHAIEEINALRGVSRGTVRIGAVASAITMLLPSAIEKLLARSPDLRFQVVEAVEDKLAIALANHDIDIAVGANIPESEDVMRIAEHEFCDTCRVIASSRHPLQLRRKLTVRDVVDQPWVMPPRDSPPRQQLEQLMISLGVSPARVAVETRSASAIRALVVRTHFLSWLPEPLYATEETAGLIRALPIDGMVLRRRFFVYRRRRGFTPPAAGKLLEELRRKTR